MHRILKNKDVLNTQLGSFTVIETPGHTIGSLCFYNSKMKLLISGDTVFPNGNFGRFDLPTGNIRQLLSSIKLLTQLPVEILIAGHGRVIKQDAHRLIKQAYITLKSLASEI
ncbi:MAG: MBL fold metallo-hydrolase [Candidatus Asgardarchaeia archaeon]